MADQRTTRLLTLARRAGESAVRLARSRAVFHDELLKLRRRARVNDARPSGPGAFPVMGPSPGLVSLAADELDRDLVALLAAGGFVDPFRRVAAKRALRGFVDSRAQEGPRGRRGRVRDLPSVDAMVAVWRKRLAAAGVSDEEIAGL